MKRMHGFTLVELMVTIIVIGVVVFIAVPNFAMLIRSNRLTTSSNELVIAMQIARSEAVKRGENVEVCARASDGSQTCSGDSATWDQGWLVWQDADGNGSVDNGEVVQAWGPLEGEYALNTGSASVEFDSQGFALNSINYTMQPSGCPTGQDRMLINVASTGRPDTTRGSCP